MHHSLDLCNWMYIPEKHFAIGSGSAFAIGAMSAGSTPRKLWCLHQSMTFTQD